jgi:hypothetical protein
MLLGLFLIVIGIKELVIAVSLIHIHSLGVGHWLLFFLFFIWLLKLFTVSL